MATRTLQRLGVFILLCVSLDFAFGAVLAKLYRRTFTGERGGLTNLALSKEVDVLVLGSSRAQFHIVSQILAERLGVRVYNAGLKGHDLLYAAMLLDLWKHRHPSFRAIVLTLDMETMLDRPDETAAAELFAPYLFESQRVKEVLIGDDPIKKFMFLSRSYPYNSKVLSIAKNLFTTPVNGYDGYLPAEGTFDPKRPPQRYGMIDVPPGVVPSAQAAIAQSEAPWSELRKRMLHAIAEDARAAGAHLFIVHPPIWNLPQKAHATWLRRMQEVLSTLPSTEFFDMCEVGMPDRFAGRPELMHDFNHLNVPGAQLFSTLLAEKLHANPL